MLLPTKPCLVCDGAIAMECDAKTNTLTMMCEFCGTAESHSFDSAETCHKVKTQIEQQTGDITSLIRRHHQGLMTDKE